MTFYPGHKQNCGENNPRYKDGRWMYRDKVDRSKCRQCGRPNEWQKGSVERSSIDVHHRDGDRSHNDKKNLAPLCPDCHNKREAVKCGRIVVDMTDARLPLRVKLKKED